MEQTQIMTTKKSVRKDGSRTGWNLLWYMGINMIASVIWLYAEAAFRSADKMQGITDAEEQRRIFGEVYAEINELSGTYMIVGVLVGLAFLFLFFRKSGVAKTMFRSEQKMTPARFAGIACVFFGLHFVFQGVYLLMEGGLNLIGFTAESSMEMAKGESLSLSRFLYVGIIAPIVEELVYRGFVLRSLEKHGKVLAVVVSSILFGIMHANLPQAAFAFGLGLILGYVAIEYSIIWSIVLHLLNNLVLNQLLQMALKGCSEQVKNIVEYSLIGIFFLIGLIIVIRKRAEIAAWIRDNMWEKPHMRWVMTTVGVILFVALHMAFAISMLERL